MTTDHAAERQHSIFRPTAPALAWTAKLAAAEDAVAEAGARAEEDRDRFEAVGAIRQLAQQILDRRVSARTAEQYRAAFARMDRTRQAPEDIAASNRNSFGYYVAAMLFCVAERVMTGAAAADRAWASGDREGWLATVAAVRQLGRLLRRYADGAARARWTMPEDGETRRGKRGQLRGLPAGWHDTMLAAMAAGKYASAAAVSYLTGARPEELATGVEVRGAGDGLLEILIRGAKVRGDAGQPWRRLTLAAIGPAAEHLVAQLAAAPDGCLMVRVASSKAYSDAMRCVSRRMWPGKPTVTPYCYRHLVSADLKAAGLTEPDIAAALGHAASVTQGRYGTRNQSRARGRIRLVAVEAARAVAPARARQPTPSARRRFGPRRNA
ncbi:hypothetical protein [Azospirillum argentinense]|uniref:hypothetical protein n=1 Tax=Azospirillum argentinense TaxID=2970906 RepID=UPI0032DFFE4C